MLTSLSITNFKGWSHADLSLGRITGLFGTNSSGKTSLIQFLLLLKQTREATDRSIALDMNGPLVELGTYKDFIYAHKEENVLEWSLEFASPDEIRVVDASTDRRTVVAASKALGVAGKIRAVRSEPVADELTYRIGESQEFSITKRGEGKRAFDLRSEGSGFDFIRTQGRAWRLPGPGKCYAFPDEARTYFQNSSFLSDLELAFETLVDGLYYIGPLREYPQRDYLWSRAKPRDVGKKGERAVEAILAATAGGEQRNLGHKKRRMSFQEMIAHWLKQLGVIYDFRVKEIGKGSNRWQVLVRSHAGGPEVLLTEVGFGVSQVLPVLTLAYYVPEGSTLILEQPEIHLHPLAQAELADLLISVAVRRNLQIIVESHSEHLLLRLQRRVAEEVIPSDDVKLYFCEFADKASRLVPLELDLLGNIHNWPKNFMGDAFGETAAAELARLRRTVPQKT